MGLYLKYIVGFLHLLLKPTSSVSLHEAWSLQNVRVKRQEGYVYDRPSVSFDLPTRSTTAATQAPVIERTQTPAVDRIQSQFMYYAYPASSSDTVNIGYSTGNTAGTSAGGGGGGGESGGAGGYNYGAQNTGTSATQPVSTGSAAGGREGYNYGTQSSGSSATQTASTGSSAGAGGNNYGTQRSVSSATQTASTRSSAGAEGYNYGTQNSGTAATQTKQTASTQSASTGYSYITPVPTVGLGTNQSPIAATTNAPKYLPPVSSGGIATGVAVNVTPGLGLTSPAYSPASVISSTGGSQTGIGITTGTPDAMYLPPVISPSSSPKPDTPPGYLPPAVSTQGSSIQNTISTPASTYLPPVI